MTSIEESLEAAETDGWDDDTCPVDTERVTKALAKRRFLMRRLREVEDWWEVETRRLNEWRTDELERIRSDVESIEALAGHLIEAVRRDEADRGIPEDKQTKTMSLPTGIIKSRPQQLEYVFADRTFVAWAKDVAPNLRRPKYEPDKVGSKKVLIPVGLESAKPGDVLKCALKDGTFADGVEVKVRPRKVTVEQ